MAIRLLKIWLSEMFEEATNETISVSDGGMGNFDVYECVTEPGRVTLNGPRYGGGSGMDSMYVVAVLESDSGAKRCDEASDV